MTFSDLEPPHVDRRIRELNEKDLKWWHNNSQSVRTVRILAILAGVASILIPIGMFLSVSQQLTKRSEEAGNAFSPGSLMPIILFCVLM